MGPNDSRYIYFMCPYYRCDNYKTGGVTCDCGHFNLGSKKYSRLYFGKYCANNPGWEKCTLAMHMTQRLLEEDDEE